MNNMIMRIALSFGLPITIGLIACVLLQIAGILADYSVEKIKEHNEKDIHDRERHDDRA